MGAHNVTYEFLKNTKITIFTAFLLTFGNGNITIIIQLRNTPIAPIKYKKVIFHQKCRYKVLRIATIWKFDSIVLFKFIFDVTLKCLQNVYKHICDLDLHTSSTMTTC